MMKFFRRIRHKFISAGKTGKYLKYAFGEIILVMIGIILALQVNNWNDQRIERNEEQLIMSNLKEDFDYNLSTLDTLLMIQNKSKQTQLAILDHTGKKSKPESEKEFNIMLEALFQTAEFYPRNGALNDLINSGRLRIIKSQKLRNRLASWESEIQKVKTREKYVGVNRDKISELIENKASWLNLDEVSTSTSATSNVFPKSGFDVDNRNLLGYLEFENFVEAEIIQMTILTKSMKESQKLAEEILVLLNEEIKN